MLSPKDRVGKFFSGSRPIETVAPDLCLNLPSGLSAEGRARYCTQLIEHGDPAMKARFLQASMIWQPREGSR